ncbi:MAG: zinc ribbon domain-containing protein [Acidobacteria bacterium]|jgi:putative FmdB family regulatory protein|nr:zinc ribbon domain-containing protein [Acidobacteriota bacterium]
MPIYEFLCPKCNVIYSFLSRRVETEKVPSCPKCGAASLKRVPSRFGVAGGSKTGADSAGGSGDLDDPRIERELMRFASELEGMDESDPRQMARAVRKMTEIAGEPVTPAMEEMIRRLEAGEDPEQVEEELGDLLEEEMGEGGNGIAGEPGRDDGLYPM